MEKLFFEKRVDDAGLSMLCRAIRERGRAEGGETCFGCLIFP